MQQGGPAAVRPPRPSINLATKAFLTHLSGAGQRLRRLVAFRARGGAGATPRLPSFRPLPVGGCAAEYVRGLGPGGCVHAHVYTRVCTVSVPVPGGPRACGVCVYASGVCECGGCAHTLGLSHLRVHVTLRPSFPGGHLPFLLSVTMWTTTLGPPAPRGASGDVRGGCWTTDPAGIPGASGRLFPAVASERRLQRRPRGRCGPSHLPCSGWPRAHAACCPPFFQTPIPEAAPLWALRRDLVPGVSGGSRGL